jgi:acyl carrier protein
MNENKIAAVVRLVATALDLPEDELGPDSSMENTPAWDSVEQMNICLAFERRFEVGLNMDAITTATSVRALAALVPDRAAGGSLST